MFAAIVGSAAWALSHDALIIAALLAGEAAIVAIAMVWMVFVQ